MQKEKENKSLKNVTNNINIYNDISKILSEINNNKPILEEAINGINEANKIIDVSKLKSFFLNFENSYDNVKKICNIFKAYSEISKMIEKANYSLIITEFVNYKDVIEKYVTKETIDNNHLDFLNIVSEIYADKIKNLKKFQDILQKYNKSLTIKNNQSLLLSPESVIPKFLSYTYRKDSNKSISEAYEESNLKIIVNKANNILNKISNINLLYRNSNKKDLFEYNSSTFALYKMNNIVQDESGFKELIDILYKGLFESSSEGNDNIILKNENFYHNQILMIIKKFRQYYFHRYEKRNDKEKIILDYISKKLGKKFPSRPKDWVDLQASIYEDINLMIDEIFDFYNK